MSISRSTCGSTRVAEHPRITKPFSEEAWTALDALGEEVDAELVADDVRLTMGGEPTFVSIDDFESGEWNTDAVGPTKRELADRLIRRLRDRFAPGGFLHYGQGKWYPGETLPRWTFSLYWRRDGKPIWPNPQAASRSKATTPAPTSRRRRRRSSTRSPPSSASLPTIVAPAYEDPAEWIVKEANLPANVYAGELQTQGSRGAPADRPGLRARPDRAFRLRAAGPALAGEGGGASLAQREMEDAPRRAATWFPATARSAIACRWARCPTFRRHHIPISSRPIRPSRAGRCRILTTPRRTRASGSPSFAAAEAGQQERVEQRLGDIDGAVRTAVTVEARDGQLCVFLPPVERLEDYLELIAAAEAAAERDRAAGADRGLSAAAPIRA